jgi:hypothetical protein
MSAFFQPAQSRRAATQKSLSEAANLGLPFFDLNTASCCRRARFSSSRSRREYSRRMDDSMNRRKKQNMGEF